MNLFSFEIKKIRNKRFLSTLIIIPMLIVLVIFLSRLLSPVDFRSEEMTRANQLLADLSWRIPNYDNYIIDPIVEISEEMQVIYDLLDEAERERFNYSIAAFYEDWYDMNVAKQKIWDLLIQVQEHDPELRALSLEELHTEKHQLDWAVEYEVGKFDFDRDYNSLFVLYNSYNILFSLPAMMLIIFFFCLPIFLEPNRASFSYVKVLPISYPKIMGQKLKLFFSIIGTYIASSVGMSLILSLFSTVSLKAQLQFPVLTYTDAGVLSKPLWQMLLFKILFFIGLTLLSLIVVTLFAKLFNNELFISFIYTILILIGQQLTRLQPARLLTYNPVAWFNLNNYLLTQSTRSIMTALLLLFIVVSLLTGLVLLRPIHLPKWQRKLKFHGIKKLTNRFLFRFEWLKLHRQAILFYSTAILAAFTLYFAVNSYQDQTENAQETSERFFNQIAQYEAEIELNLEQELIHHDLLTIPDLPRSTEEDFKNYILMLQNERQELENKLSKLKDLEAEVLDNNYQGLSQIEFTDLENDYHFVTRTGTASSSQVIPVPDPIFIPNAYINYRLSEWKLEKGIDYVTPGGPYQTLFTPTYQESPRSGEDEPPAMVEKDVFDRYLAEVNKEHHTLSGLNLLADFFNHYYFVVLLILLVGFYSLSYVREWDGSGTIRYLLVQPISLKRTFTAKIVASLSMGICFTLLVGLITFIIGSLLNGVGQLEFPFIQYISYAAGNGKADQLIEIPMQLKYFRILPLWQWLLIGTGLLLSNLFFVNQVVYLVSTYLKNQWLVMAVSLCALGAGLLLAIIWPHEIHAFLPFHYLDISQIMTGKMATIHDYAYLNWWLGIIVQTVSGVILTVFALRRVRRNS